MSCLLTFAVIEEHETVLQCVVLQHDHVFRRIFDE